MKAGAAGSPDRKVPIPNDAPLGGGDPRGSLWDTNRKRLLLLVWGDQQAGAGERRWPHVSRCSKARIAEILNAHPHRFRHTLATEILAKGGTLQDVADILGISIKVAEKHYEKWSPARQERIFGLMRAVQSGTVLAQREKGAVIN